MIDFVTPARHAEAETHAIAFKLFSAFPPQLPNYGCCGIKALERPTKAHAMCP